MGTEQTLNSILLASTQARGWIKKYKSHTFVIQSIWSNSGVDSEMCGDLAWQILLLPSARCVGKDIQTQHPFTFICSLLLPSHRWSSPLHSHGTGEWKRASWTLCKCSAIEPCNPSTQTLSRSFWYACLSCERKCSSSMLLVKPLSHPPLGVLHPSSKLPTLSTETLSAKCFLFKPKLKVDRNCGFQLEKVIFSLRFKVKK